MARESRHLSTYVDRRVEDVYAYVADPANLPHWAAGLSGSIEERDGRWFADSPMGPVEVRFAPENAYGVLDHDVTLPDGTTFANPLRVLADGDVTEVVFTLRRAPGTSDQDFEADAAAVRTDLATLKALLEGGQPRLDRMSLEPWTSPAFHEEIRPWVARQLAPGGEELTGEWAQPHARPWSSAIRLETTRGRVWFKVNGPGTRHEPALLRLLRDRVPDLVPEVVAVDLGRGWSLSRDAGPVLRTALAPDQSWAPWEGVVSRYAEAQLRLTSDRAAVLATGVREVSAATVPGLAGGLVEELAARPVDQGGLGRDEVDRLTAVLPRLGSWCAEMAASGIPDSVQHDDLHSGNVCWTGSVETSRIIDWGDTTWGFPLATLLGTLSSVAEHAGLPLVAPEVLRVRDAYLEPFTAYAARDDLVRHVDLAWRTGRVGKALAYRAAFEGVAPVAQAEMGHPVRAWLLGLVDG